MDERKRVDASPAPESQLQAEIEHLLNKNLKLLYSEVYRTGTITGIYNSSSAIEKLTINNTLGILDKIKIWVDSEGKYITNIELLKRNLCGGALTIL